MAKKLVPGLLYGTFALAVVVACSSVDRTFDDGSSGGPGDPASSSGVIGSSGGVDSGTGTGLEKCATETLDAKGMPVDLFIMLDTSGSMDWQTGVDGSGPTKLKAVQTALKGFINDPKSAGVGIGLQTFPINAPASPACTTSAQCNVGGKNFGKCDHKVCGPKTPKDPIQYCDSDMDCDGTTDGHCYTMGDCVFLGTTRRTRGLCISGHPLYGGCGLLASCKAWTSGACTEAACEQAAYSPPKVAISPLPGNAGQLASAIDNAKADGTTPTAAALKSALDIAKAHAAANPGHIVAVVLATDGLPSACAPMDASQIAATIAAPAAAGAPSIKTFVIGVFSDDEKASATTNLNALANGGGTGKAFVISTSGNVTADFQTALDTIRSSAMPCDYDIPKPASGSPDFDKVNAQFTTSSGPTVVPYKKSEAGCDPSSGGWYYDVDPSTGNVPTKIKMCPATCKAVKSGSGGAKVEIILGCRTIVQ